jgi:hypothetical protein
MTIAIGGEILAGGFLGAGSNTTGNITTQSLGSTILGIYCGKQFGAGSFADNKSNSFAQTLADIAINGTFCMLNVWTCQNANGGAGHNGTFTPANYPGYVDGLLEITGAAVSSLDQSTSSASTGTSTTLTTASVTTTQPNEMLIGIIGCLGNVTFSAPTNGFTIFDSANDGSSGESVCILTKVVSATGTYSTGVTASASQTFAGVMLSFIQGGGNPIASSLSAYGLGPG